MTSLFILLSLLIFIASFYVDGLPLLIFGFLLFIFLGPTKKYFTKNINNHAIPKEENKAIGGIMKKNLIQLAIIAILFGSCINYFFPSDLRKLHDERKIAAQEIRSHLIKFKKDNDCFPKSLAELVPGYIKEIPHVLQRDKYEGFYEISYEASGDDAYFIFNVAKTPDSRITYHVNDGKFVYSQ